MGRRSRKRARTPAQEPKRRPKRPPGPSRTELKDAEARAALEPLGEGERPAAVTVGAILAAILALLEIVLYAAGLEIQDERPSIVGVAALAVLLGVMAWGMWGARYWAVLGMEALLGITLVVFALRLMFVENVKTALICLAVLAACGSLFWFLVRAMARIQMPERR